VDLIRLPDVERRDRSSVAVGTFDGVHLGHREVIRGSESVLTFDPHPVSVVAPEHTPKLLTTLERKAELIESLGVGELIVIPFDAEFASCSAEQFIEDVLLGALCAQRVAIGENFRFGHRARGDRRLLAADGRFVTVVHPLLELDGDLYGSRLRLEFLERLRGERRFESPEALVEQMRADVERTREIIGPG
jgi:riboflavin kinase/FMN adenylyltransferase